MKKRRAKLIQLSEALAREGEEDRAAAVIDLLPQDEAEWLQDLIEYQKARQVGGSQASTPAAEAQRAGEAGGLPDPETNEPAPPPGPEGRIKRDRLPYVEIEKTQWGHYLATQFGRNSPWQYFNAYSGVWYRDRREATSFASHDKAAEYLERQAELNGTPMPRSWWQSSPPAEAYIAERRAAR